MPALSKTPTSYATDHKAGGRVRNEGYRPGMGLCWRMIQDAIYQASKYPTAHSIEARIAAIEARQWIERRANWHDTLDFLGSFDFCCHWLGFATWPAEVEAHRQRALAQVDNAWRQAEKTDRALYVIPALGGQFELELRFA